MLTWVQGGGSFTKNVKKQPRAAPEAKKSEKTVAAGRTTLPPCK